MGNVPRMKIGYQGEPHSYSYRAATELFPEDDHLADELCSIRWKVSSAGQIQIEPKSDLRSRLGRSPDRADAVAMAVWGQQRAAEQNLSLAGFEEVNASLWRPKPHSLGF